MEKALNSILINDTGINDVVSGRISIMRRDDLFPAITYESTGLSQDKDIGGRPSGPIQSTFDITSRAKTYRQAKEIAGLITARLAQTIGEVVEDIKIQLSVKEDEQPNNLTEPDITEITLSYTFYHN